MTEMWKRTREYVLRMWENLTVGQRVALGILLALLGATIFWTVSSATPAGQVVLVPGNGDRNAALREGARAALDARRIPYQFQDGAIMVRREDYDRAFLDLYGAGLFDDSEIYKFLNSMSLTATRYERNKLWLVATQHRIAQLIMQMRKYGNVQVVAQVPTDPPVLGVPIPEVTASVLCDLVAGAEADVYDIRAIAGVVQGAFPELEDHPENIHITTVAVDGTVTPWQLPEKDADAATTWQWRETENAYARDVMESIGRVLRGSPYWDAVATARVMVNRTRTEDLRHSEEPGEPSTEERTIDQERSDAQSFQPGVVMGGQSSPQQVLPYAGPGVNSRSSHNESNVRASMTTDNRSQTIPAGAIDNVSVAVMIPHVPPVVNGQPWDGLLDPSNPQLMAGLPREVRNLYDLIVHATGAVAAGTALPVPQVHISYLGERTVSRPGAIPFSEQAWFFLRENWLRLSLVLLAVVSLGMVYRLVKNALAARGVMGLEDIEKAVAGVEAPELAALEEAEQKTARMRAFIKDLVGKNPRAVASVLRRWMQGK